MFSRTPQISIPQSSAICYSVFFTFVRNNLAIACYSHLTPSEKENFPSLKLTSDRALEILKKVEYRAKVNAFLFQPTLLLAAGFTLLAPFLMISAPCLLLDIAVRVMFVIGGGLTGFSFDARTLQLTQKYTSLGEEASKYIEKIENTTKAEVTIDLPILKNPEVLK
jgi:hypothetical protein